MNLEDYSREELIALIKKYEVRKKYGLVWEGEQTKENFESKIPQFLPILFEVKKKRVNTVKKNVQNYLIEGDNFFALNALRFSHNEAIDIIYIDPPYNTGNKDFKYNDNFVKKDDAYRHSKWLNFISKRLILAKNLLKEDGIIFISIDDNEFAQLKLLCDSVFGENKFIACFVWEKKRKASNLDSTVRGITEYVLAYGGRYPRPIIHPLDLVEEEKPYPFYNTGNTRSILSFPAGISFSSMSDGVYSPKKFNAKKTFVELLDSVTLKQGKSMNTFRLGGEWRYSQKWLDNAIKLGEEIIFKGYDFKPYWINRDPDRFKKMKTLLNYENYQIGTNEDGNEELFQIIGPNDFSFPKPISLIKALVSATTGPKTSATILDFFAGSGTTGEAVLQLNHEDGGSRNFILVTNNEDNICEDVTYPRIKNAMKGYVASNGEVVEGFGGSLKYFKTKFLRKSLSNDEIKIMMTENCVDMLCMKEGIFDEDYSNEFFSVFKNENYVLGIYHSYDNSNLNHLKNELNKFESRQKKAYIFTFDNSGLNPNDFLDWKGIILEPIPQKMLEVLAGLYA